MMQYKIAYKDNGPVVSISRWSAHKQLNFECVTRNMKRVKRYPGNLLATGRSSLRQTKLEESINAYEPFFSMIITDVLADFFYRQQTNTFTTEFASTSIYTDWYLSLFIPFLNTATVNVKANRDLIHKTDSISVISNTFYSYFTSMLSHELIVHNLVSRVEHFNTNIKPIVHVYVLIWQYCTACA